MECVLENSHSEDSLINGGSKINVMTKALWKDLNLPIDMQICWQMETMSSAGKEPYLGVIYDLPARVEGVEVLIHCFVVAVEGRRLILCRP